MRAFTLATLTSVILAAGTLTMGGAAADDVMQVTWRKAQLMNVGSGVASIIIGDPSVIDVTLEGNGQIVVFGKVPGETNMTILGADNSVLFDSPVVVMPEDARHISIISPGNAVVEERTWNCLTRCVQVLGPGSIRYTSVRGMGGGSSGLAAADAGAGGASGSGDAAAAAGQTAQDVGNMNSATAKGAGGVAGQSGTMIAPY